jgi:hypothetical protein
MARHQRYFGNARTVLSLFDLIQSRLAERVVPLAKGKSEEALAVLLSTLLPEDVPEPQAYVMPRMHPRHEPDRTQNNGLDRDRKDEDLP